MSKFNKLYMTYKPVIQAGVFLFKKHQIVAYRIVIVVTILLLYMTWILPDKALSEEKKAVMRDYKGRLKQQQELVLDEAAFAREKEIREQALLDSRQRLFSTKELSLFSINILPKIVEDHKGLVGNISYKKHSVSYTTADFQLIKHPLQLHYQTTFKYVLRLIEELKRFEKLIQITEVSVKRKDKTSDQLSVRMNLVIYAWEDH